MYATPRSPQSSATLCHPGMTKQIADEINDQLNKGA
jgi:hypothetical protein